MQQLYSPSNIRYSSLQHIMIERFRVLKATYFRETLYSLLTEKNVVSYLVVFNCIYLGIMLQNKAVHNWQKHAFVKLLRR